MVKIASSVHFWSLCLFLPFSQSHWGWNEGLPRHVGGFPGIQQHDRNGGWHCSSSGTVYSHPALCYVQIPEQGRRFVPRGWESQLHQQLGTVQRHSGQGEASQHRKNLKQEQEEQGQGVLCVIVKDLVFADQFKHFIEKTNQNIDMCTAK